ncbi:hypothetical protein [Streptomyces rhizosphaerihabitans]|uniref:hypothetical protein n=1 Tax=Streptomyces rhizosphaerihabitans TaxID=1266770 RepID=UPI0021C06C02|nr:hypothetical protein [Streptomyces rhizosphaerihabitans]MCT9004905.1 hypothetical protein [Streptomyces rhizosphaerihabitans]
MPVEVGPARARAGADGAFGKDLAGQNGGVRAPERKIGLPAHTLGLPSYATGSP